MKIKDIGRLIERILFDPSLSKYVCICVLICEYFLLNLIIEHVPYTEIDYSTYMQQITQIEEGERDYSKIGGDTGPIVYPGGYVIIYKILKRVTCGMERIQDGQHLFKWVYLASLGLAFSVVHRASKAPPYVYVLTAGSKRLHSVYVLRLFNDCFTTFFVLLGVACLQNWSSNDKYVENSNIKTKQINANVNANANVSTSTSTITAFLQGHSPPLSTSSTRFTSAARFVSLLLATASLTFACTVKMNALLAAPAAFVLVLSGKRRSVLGLCAVSATAVLVAGVASWPFAGAGIPAAQRWAYLRGSFDVSRLFLQRWSVNWAFLPAEVFVSRVFHTGLLCLWLVLLVAVMVRGAAGAAGVAGERKVAWTCCTAVLAGVLCARSLHYQFLAWYAHTLPWLLWECLGRAGSKWLALVAVSATWFLHEWCWNVYPATAISSAILVSLLASVVVRLLVLGPVTNVSSATVPPINSVTEDGTASIVSNDHTHHLQSNNATNHIKTD